MHNPSDEPRFNDVIVISGDSEQTWRRILHLEKGDEIRKVMVKAGWTASQTN